MNVTAKTAKDTKPYNQRKQYTSSESTGQGSTSARKQKDAKPYNQMKQYTSSNSTSQSSTSARKQNTDDLENYI